MLVVRLYVCGIIVSTFVNVTICSALCAGIPEGGEGGGGGGGAQNSKKVKVQGNLLHVPTTLDITHVRKDTRLSLPFTIVMFCILEPGNLGTRLVTLYAGNNKCF